MDFAAGTEVCGGVHAVSGAAYARPCPNWTGDGNTQMMA